MSWTESEKRRLIELYESHTDDELCSILNKTSGQLRGMKERLHLHSKFRAITDEEKATISEWYLNHTSILELDELSRLIGRPKTTISRCAKELGLTIGNRPLSDAAIQKGNNTRKRYLSSEEYIRFVKPAQTELLSYYAKNKHPRGMAGKHHKDSAKMRISRAVTMRWEKMGDAEKREFIARRKAACAAKGMFHTTENSYSRCHGGIRDDLGHYFRSSWEANYARFLNYFGISWEYEKERFQFPDTGCGVLSYCPDFYLPDLDRYIEIKGWMDEKSVIRIRLFEEYYPEEFSKLIVVCERDYLRLQKEYGNQIECWE